MPGHPGAKGANNAAKYRNSQTKTAKNLAAEELKGKTKTKYPYPPGVPKASGAAGSSGAAGKKGGRFRKTRRNRKH